MVTQELDAVYWDNPEPDCRGDAAGQALRDFAREEEQLRNQVLFRTSGSSGVPRWVALSKDALRWSAGRVNEHLRCGAEDRWGCALPVDHVGGYGVLARAFVAGGSVSVFPGKWSAPGFVEFCRRERITVTSLVPAQVYDLVSAGLTSSPSLRVVVVGGGALSGELARRARILGWPVRASYGMTETASQIATELDANGTAEAGLPLIVPWEAKVDDGGRIWVRGGGLLSYYVMPQGDGWALERPADAGGWFRTEDVGRISASGCLIVEGRAGRVVKILGELVSLDRLDRIWEELGGDAGGESVISTLPDERRGLVVVLVISGSWDSGQLQRCRERFDERVAPYERIAGVLQVREIPRTELGKVRHEDLHRMLLQKSG